MVPFVPAGLTTLPPPDSGGLTMWPEKNADETTPEVRAALQKMFAQGIEREGRMLDADLDMAFEKVGSQSPEAEEKYREKKRERLNRWFRDTYAAQFAQALADQKNSCAICLVPFTDTDRPRVD